MLYRFLIFPPSSLVRAALVEGVSDRHRLGLSVPSSHPSHPQRGLLRFYGTQNLNNHSHELPDFILSVIIMDIVVATLSSIPPSLGSCPRSPF